MGNQKAAAEFFVWDGICCKSVFVVVGNQRASEKGADVRGGGKSEKKKQLDGGKNAVRVPARQTFVA